MAHSCEEQIPLGPWSKEVKMFNEAQESLFQDAAYHRYWFKSPVVTQQSQPAVLLLKGLGEGAIHKQKVKIFDLKHRDTENLTLLSNLQ